MEAAVEVGFLLQFCVGIGIGADAVRTLGLEVFHVDLPRDALVAVLDAGGPFAHLYALHPRPGHVGEGVGDGCAAQVGHVFREHLHIGATQSQQFDLPCSRRRIAVGNVHRGIGGEGLAQVAARRPHEFAFSDDVGVGNAEARLASRRCFDRHVVEVVAPGHGVLHHAVRRVRCRLGDSMERRADYQQECCGDFFHCGRLYGRQKTHHGNGPEFLRERA